MSYLKVGKKAACIGCGCDDFHACPEGCWWLEVDYARGRGVCSSCADEVERFLRGDDAVRGTSADELEALAEGRQRIPNPDRAPRPCVRGDHDWPFEDVRDSDVCRQCGMNFVRHIFTECH